MLQNCRQPLQSHSRVDAGLRERRQRAGVVAVELHEHEVPDLDVAVAFSVGRSRRAAGDLRAMVVEDLGARAARTGIGHLPEVVGNVLRLARLVADPNAALGRHADVLGPDVVGLVVVDVDRRPELVLRQLVDLGQQLPRVADRVALEVVAEAEVAQHLEERVVPSGVADVLQVVVLAAGAQRLLRRCGTRVWALLAPSEHVLELHHAAVDEQQRRIVGRHEGSTPGQSCVPWTRSTSETCRGCLRFSWRCHTACGRACRFTPTDDTCEACRTCAPARGLSDGRSRRVRRSSGDPRRRSAPRAPVPTGRIRR